MWYAALLLFVQMQTVPAAIVCLMLAGFSQSLCMISIAVILMRASSAHFRGRVMGVRMLVIYGLPFGLLAAGSLIDEIGFAATGTLYATIGLALMMTVVCTGARICGMCMRRRMRGEQPPICYDRIHAQRDR